MVGEGEIGMLRGEGMVAARKREGVPGMVAEADVDCFNIQFALSMMLWELFNFEPVYVLHLIAEDSASEFRNKRLT